MEKCRRLQCEMNELMEEIAVLQGDASTSEDDKKSYEAVGEVVGASQKMLESLRLEQALGKEGKSETEAKRLLSQVAEFKKSGAMSALPREDKSAHSARVSELDQRLHLLEKAIGAKPEKLNRLGGFLNTSNLIDGAQQLATRAALLQPNQLDLIEARLQNITAKMDVIGGQTASTESPTDDKKSVEGKELKMNELYAMAKRTEPIAKSLPEVLGRMQALESLHKYANNFSKLLGELETTQSSITAGIGSNKKLMQNVQEAFAENLENVNKEVAKLEVRLAGLETRGQTL